MLGTGVGHANMQLSGSRNSNPGSVVLKPLLFIRYTQKLVKIQIAGPYLEFLT